MRLPVKAAMLLALLLALSAACTAEKLDLTDLSEFEDAQTLS